MAELETLIEAQGRAFEEFKKSHDEQLAELKKGIHDPVLTDRIAKIEKSLDAAVEAKAALEASLKAEAAEREALEVKIGRMGLSGHSRESAEREAEVKSLNDILGALNAERRRSFEPFDAKGYDEYRAAVEHYLRDGKDAMSPNEIKLMQVGSDPDGGQWVTPDVSGRIARKVHETSPVRQNANVTTISTDALEGVEDLGEAGVGYAGEHSLSGDTTTPQIGNWRIAVYHLDTEPKVTQQLLDDSSVDVEAFLSAKVSDKFGRFENSEFINGTNKIRGFVAGYTTAEDTGSGVTWGSVGFMKTGVDADFAASDPADNLIDIVGLLKNEYLANAKFYTRRSVITKIRKFKTTDHAYLWQPSLVAGTPEMIMGYPVVRMEDMPALANDSFSLAFGDLAQAYQIVDRQGIRVVRDALTAKPYVKFYTTKRTGGGMVNYEAIKLMKFTS